MGGGISHGPVKQAGLFAKLRAGVRIFSQGSDSAAQGDPGGRSQERKKQDLSLFPVSMLQMLLTDRAQGDAGGWNSLLQSM